MAARPSFVSKLSLRSAHNRRGLSSLCLSIGLSAAVLSGCDQKPKDLAPEAASFEESAANNAAAATEQTFLLDASKTAVGFTMDAPLEKIEGRAPNAAAGELLVNLADLSKSHGLVKIDLLQLSIYQQKREDAEGEFGEAVKNESQNEHMRTWLQISEDGPAEEREKNRFIEFKLESVKTTGSTRLADLTGDTRKLDVEVSGKLRLHGRVTEHSFPAEAVFTFNGSQAEGLSVTAKKPIQVSLEKHDVRPRKSYHELAGKTLAALGQKVATVAEVTLSLHASAK